MLHAIICYCHVAKIQVSASQVIISYCYDTYKQNPNKCIVQVLVNAEHYGRAGANPPSLTVRDHVYTCRLVPCFISFFPQLNCHHGHVTVPVDIGILLLYIYNYAHLVFNEIT